MKQVLSVITVAAASLLALPTVHAKEGTDPLFRATEVGALEDPANASPGYGTTTIDVNGTTLTVNSMFQFLEGNATASHVHCCTSTPFSGNAPIAVPFTNFPAGLTSGTFTETIDLTKDSSFDPGFLASHGGSASAATDALIAGMEAHEAYVNVHSASFPAGEIRGFLVAAPIPEPGSWAMLGLGLAGLGFVARRKA